LGDSGGGDASLEYARSDNGRLALLPNCEIWEDDPMIIVTAPSSQPNCATAKPQLLAHNFGSSGCPNLYISRMISTSL
jgi:hypothetical protein